MKALNFLLIGFLAVLAPRSVFADEPVFPWDALHGEKQFRATVESRFPGLEFGFYHWGGDLIFGALEDFDQHRILMLVPLEGVGDVELSRNGKVLALPPGEPALVRIAGIILTPEGEIGDPNRAGDVRVGYWIPLEATDSFSLVTKLTWPAEGEFQATYDPDGRWKTSFRWAKAEHDRREPADAYEISRRSLLNRTLEVLGEKKKCLVRLKKRVDITIITPAEGPDEDIEPLHIGLSDKIVLGVEAWAKETSLRELERALEVYTEAIRSAGSPARVRLEVEVGADDEIFRATLNALGEHRLAEVSLVEIPAVRDEE